MCTKHTRSLAGIPLYVSLYIIPLVSLLPSSSRNIRVDAPLSLSLPPTPPLSPPWISYSLLGEIRSGNSDKNILFCLLCKQEIPEMEQNETGCQAPQAPILCVNNCGFFGTAATMNMCSKCYKDHILKQEQAKLAASSIQKIVNGSSGAEEKECIVAASTNGQTASPETTAATPQASSASEKSDQIKGSKRCGTCRKRVGLTGFNCRCGGIFCSVHRYSDKHECPFDYRTEGQEAIAKANPVVKPEKLDKI